MNMWYTRAIWMHHLTWIMSKENKDIPKSCYKTKYENLQEFKCEQF